MPRAFVQSAIAFARVLARTSLAALTATAAFAAPDPPPASSNTETNPLPALAVTNAAAPPAPPKLAGLPPSDNFSENAEQTRAFTQQIELARKLREQSDWSQAEPILTRILEGRAPPPAKRDALLELGLLAEARQQWTRAQQIHAQFIRLYPEDLTVPDLYLRQGLIYRNLGAPNMALGKFYAVMSAALSLKFDNLERYQRLVLRAQTEIADTYYLQGKFSDAAEFFVRLLRLNDPALNQAQITYKLIRTLSALQRNEECVARAQAYLEKNPATSESPEVRFLLADALRKLGRTHEATAQVLTLLQSQQAVADARPDLWRYWQQRTGNEISNQLYKDGDYLNAHEIYSQLVALDDSPAWRMPLQYQIGLVCEKLEQPDRAAAAFQSVIDASARLGTNATPALEFVVSMARWRLTQTKWSGQSAARLSAIATNAPPSAAKP
ncbi:MAG: tetratricopeptide repeat protein [Verrucomicrobiota bacterium]